MLILDLSTTFNTVDHSILLRILNKSFGFCDQALKWFNMYMQPRWFKVCIDGTTQNQWSYGSAYPRVHVFGPICSPYCSLITSCIPPQLNINGFADNHSIGQGHKPRSKISLQVRATMESTLDIKQGLDGLHASKT